MRTRCSSGVARRRPRPTGCRRVRSARVLRPAGPRLGPSRTSDIHTHTGRCHDVHPRLSHPLHTICAASRLSATLFVLHVPPPHCPRTRSISARRQQRQCPKPRGNRQPTMSDSAPGVRCLLTNPALPCVTLSMSARAGAEAGTTPTPSIYGGAAERYCSRIRSAMGLSSALHGRSTLEDRCIRKNARGRDGRM